VAEKVGRNSPCPCGSGTKYKKCCLIKTALPAPLPPTDDELNGVAPAGVVPGTKHHMMKSFVWRGYRWRAIWNRLHYRPVTETFHDFLIGLMKGTLTREWEEAQEALPQPQQHVVVRWLIEIARFKRLPNNPLQLGRNVYVATGVVNAALSLAYDLYFLQLVNKLPASLVDRLRDRVQFQGARYEIAIAATFVRAGFEIELLDEVVKKEKHCEFIAKHRQTNTEVYVEAKSRVRPGVLNEAGTFDETKTVKAGVRQLYQSALSQAPHDKVFLIFVDVNLPTDTLPPPEEPTHSVPYDNIPWMIEIETMLKDDWNIDGRDKTAETAVIITSFAPHFGESDAAAPTNVFAIVPSPKPKNPLVDPYVTDDLFFALRNYATVPKEL
jgi:SEC-C motif